MFSKMFLSVSVFAIAIWAFQQQPAGQQNSVAIPRAEQNVLPNLTPQPQNFRKSIPLIEEGRKVTANIYKNGNTESLQFWTVASEDYQLLHSVESEPGESFGTPTAFRQNGEQFIYAPTQPVGSGGFVNERIFWVAPDQTIHPVEFDHAGVAYEQSVKTGEIVLTGGPGIIITKESLQFDFLIAREEDPHCCPTAGRITGTYRISGSKQFDETAGRYSCTFKITTDKLTRSYEPAPEDHPGLVADTIL